MWNGRCIPDQIFPVNLLVTGVCGGGASVTVSVWHFQMIQSGGLAATAAAWPLKCPPPAGMEMVWIFPIVFKFNLVWKIFYLFVSDLNFEYSISLTNAYLDSKSYVFMVATSIIILFGKN